MKQNELEAKLRDTLKEHQREGMNIIGNVDQLLQRLVRAVKEWTGEEHEAKRKSA